MDDQTQPPFPPSGPGPGTGPKEGSIFGFSSRSWIVFLICWTVCLEFFIQAIVWAYICLITKTFLPLKVEEPLYSLVIVTVGYYFGQNQKLTQPKL